MKTFFRINNNQLFSAGDVERLGFKKSDGYRIPDEYLEKQEFVVMRTCHGIGDWCIISAIPRLLKSKYPNCKVYVPSKNMLKLIYGDMLKQWGYGTYDCSNITHDIFINNPYVDGFIDEYNGEIYHDHYRIYDEDNDKVSLVEQMLKFWQFEDNECIDSTPDIYFSDEEIQFGNKLIENLIGQNKDYGYVGVNHATFGSTANTSTLINKVKEYSELPWFHYSEIPIEDTDLNFLKGAISVKELNLNIRQQMYLRCNAKLNVGNETGMTLWVSKYSKTYVLGNEIYGHIHGGEKEGKTRKNPFRSGNFIRNINYLNHE